MGFRRATEVSSGTSFNSAVSANFKALYDDIVYKKCQEDEARKPSQTFAPSSFRCDRLSYFRLRGVDPDEDLQVNTGLKFTADLGTACHRVIQSNLRTSIGDQWVAVGDYLADHPIAHQYVINAEDEFETKIEFLDPPVKFACDGIIRIGDEFYLLEIKTSEYQSFKQLKEPKAQHIDQVVCYCALLELHHALVFYQERGHGDTKCFEVTVTDYQMRETFERMNRVLENVKNNIAPSRLPSGDYWCSFCKYKNRCKQWG